MNDRQLAERLALAYQGKQHLVAVLRRDEDLHQAARDHEQGFARVPPSTSTTALPFSQDDYAFIRSLSEPAHGCPANS